MKVETGVVHEVPGDLKEALTSFPEIVELWNRLTPLGRNEFICWVIDAKKPETKIERISRTCNELLAGMRRPCCWPGCKHR